MSFAFGGELDAVAPFVAAQDQIKKVGNSEYDDQ